MTVQLSTSPLSPANFSFILKFYLYLYKQLQILCTLNEITLVLWNALPSFSHSYFEVSLAIIHETTPAFLYTFFSPLTFNLYEL